MRPTDCADHGGLKGSCPGCPFNDGYTEEAAMGQNYGCLPSGADILRIKRETGQNWACHDDERRTCAGLCHAARTEGLDLTQGNLVRYSSWYQAGEAAAVHEARTGMLFQAVDGALFETMTQGRRNEDGTRTEPTVHVPRLKYFAHRTGFEALHNPDRRTMLMAMTAPEPEGEHAGLRLVRGLLQMEVNPYDACELWVSYLTVDPAWQRRGIARGLLDMMVEQARSRKMRLSLSYATEEGQRKIQPYIDALLDASGITWSQSGRDDRRAA